MNKKHYLLIQALGYLVSVIILLIIISYNKFSEIDNFGRVFGILFLLFLSYKSFSTFKKIKRTKKEDKIYSPPNNATNEEIKSFYKKIVYVSIPAFIVLSIWMYIDLKNIETGNVKSVMIPKPIEFIYKKGGYLLAVFATPFSGALCCFVLWLKIKKQKIKS